jgi:hypothetical protein
MNLMKSLRNLALVVTLFSASVAQASVLQFTLTGDYSASWQMNSTVTPDAYGTGEGFLVWDVDGFPDAILGVADLTFWNAEIGGGLEIYDFYNDVVLLSTDGPQLYSGSEASPTFLLGTFALTEFLGSGNYSLTIAEVGAPPAAVPEPATGFLLIGGLALMGALRKRRNG